MKRILRLMALCASFLFFTASVMAQPTEHSFVLEVNAGIPKITKAQCNYIHKTWGCIPPTVRGTDGNLWKISLVPNRLIINDCVITSYTTRDGEVVHTSFDTAITDSGNVLRRSVLMRIADMRSVIYRLETPFGHPTTRIYGDIRIDQVADPATATAGNSSSAREAPTEGDLPRLELPPVIDTGVAPLPVTALVPAANAVRSPPAPTPTATTAREDRGPDTRTEAARLPLLPVLNALAAPTQAATNNMPRTRRRLSDALEFSKSPDPSLWE